MHHTEIDHEAPVTNGIADLEDDGYGDRPVQLAAFVMIDGTDLLVPVDQDGPQGPEGMTLALTVAQALQVLGELEDQLGHEVILKALKGTTG